MSSEVTPALEEGGAASAPTTTQLILHHSRSLTVHRLPHLIVSISERWCIKQHHDVLQSQNET